MAEADAAPAPAPTAPAPAAPARPWYHPRNCQLVMADDTVHEFLTDRESDRMWVLSACVNKELNEGPPVRYVTRRGRRVLQWQDPRQPDPAAEAAPVAADPRGTGQNPRQADVQPLWLPTPVAEPVTLRADPRSGRAAEAALRALLEVLLDLAATASLAHAIRRFLSLRP